MMKFLRGDFDVLVSTTIIESGLDIPQANTLIVERADTLGLAQLYQIRGRVGRSDAVAHAFLFYPDRRELSEEARHRLSTLADYTELGSGYRIAMRDLELRGAGNLLGDEQSGHVAAVGFELYCELLAEAVAELQGAPPVAARPVRVEAQVDAYVPADYVPLEAVKIDLHRARGAWPPTARSCARSRPSWPTASAPCPSRSQTCSRSRSCGSSAAEMGIASASLRGGTFTRRPDRARIGRDARAAGPLPGGALHGRRPRAQPAPGRRAAGQAAAGAAGAGIARCYTSTSAARSRRSSLMGRIPLIICLAAVAAFTAACGGSSSSSSARQSLQSGDVAVVGGTHITKSDLDHQIKLELAAMKVKKQTIPQVGTASYQSTVVQPVLQYLVTDAQVHNIAKTLSVVGHAKGDPGPGLEGDHAVLRRQPGQVQGRPQEATSSPMPTWPSSSS